MADQSEPKSNQVALVGFIAALILFAIILGSLYFLPFAIQQEVHERVETAPTTALNNLRDQENEKLNYPAYVDRAAGIVRIPISLAMQLEARHPWRDDLPVPAHTFPTSTTTTAAPTATPTATPKGGQ